MSRGYLQAVRVLSSTVECFSHAPISNPLYPATFTGSLQCFPRMHRTSILTATASILQGDSTGVIFARAAQA